MGTYDPLRTPLQQVAVATVGVGFLSVYYAAQGRYGWAVAYAAQVTAARWVVDWVTRTGR